MINVIAKPGHLYKQQGFTLLEVIIAIGLIAIALPALMFSMAQVNNSVADTNRDSIAHWVAYNQLEIVKLEYQLNEKLLKGEISGEAEMAGATWEWKVRSEQSQLPGMWLITSEAGLGEQDPVSVVGFIRADEEKNQGQRNR